MVGISGLFGTAYAYIGTSIYFALGAVALYALGVTPFVTLAVGVLFIGTAWSYAEASAAMPEASGVASFARRAFNPLAGFGAAWAILLDSIILVAIACFFIPHYLGALWPSLQQSPYDVIIGIGTVALLVALNVLGLAESIRVNVIVAVLGGATLILLVVLGFVFLFKPGLLIEQIAVGDAPTWSHLLYAVPLAGAAFVGIDAVSSRAESAVHPGRDVPLALNVILPVIVILSVALAVVALSAMPVKSNTVPVNPRTGLTEEIPVIPGETRGTYVLAVDPSRRVYVPVERREQWYVIPAQEPTGEVYDLDGQPVTLLYGSRLGSVYIEDPVIGLVDALPKDLQGLKDILRPWVAFLMAIGLFLAANAVVGGSGRIIYSLARHRQVPAWMGRMSASRMTPFVGIILFGVAAAALIIPGDTTLLLDLFGFGAAVAFTLASVSVITLRYRERGLSRPFSVPLDIRFRGAALPLPSVFAAAATAVIWVLMVATHPWGRIAGFAWMAAGIVLYVLYRRRARLPLLRPAELTTLPKAVTEDIDYERILVPVLGTRLTDEMVVLGCQLATEKDSTIDALYVIEVPMELAVDAPQPEERRKGKKVLELAAKVAEDFDVELWPHIAQARSPGKAIVETAEEWDVDVIILGAPRKRRMGGAVFGRTVTYVLQNAPCEVIVNLVPADYPMEGSASEVETREGASEETETREGASEGTETREGAPGDAERGRDPGGSTGDGDDRPGPAREERK